MAVFQSASPEGSPISLNTRSIMPSRRSPLLATWLYSDIASTPRTSPSLRMLSEEMPLESAKATAARSTRSLLSGDRGRVVGLAGDAIGVGSHRGLDKTYTGSIGSTYGVSQRRHKDHWSHRVHVRPESLADSNVRTIGGAAARHRRRGDDEGDRPR